MFGFRNPGMMRVPVDIALRGGESDCRNRTLHQMFRMVGIGEQAGSGVPKILQGWKAQHWNPPKLHELSEPYDQTLLELRMIDLFPEEAVDNLRHFFGSRFDALEHTARVALALASSEGTVNHARLCTLSADHPVDLPRALHSLVQHGFLKTSGSGRGVVYFLPWQDMPIPDEIFPVPASEMSGGGGLNDRSSASSVRSTFSHTDGRTQAPEAVRGVDGCLHTPQLHLPVIDRLEGLTDALRAQLEALAAEPRAKGRLDKAKMEEVILCVCDQHYVTLQALAALLDRAPDALRNRYLSPMVRDKKLALAFPQSPTHERQAYRSAKTASDIR
ncbi:MAG: hypothetical protein FJX25_17555 [Alphaproteobacteria bacterium]|nr:hypothetical protein [Alphaproteobacteria bacterium]